MLLFLSCSSLIIWQHVTVTIAHIIETIFSCTKRCYIWIANFTCHMDKASHHLMHEIAVSISRSPQHSWWLAHEKQSSGNWKNLTLIIKCRKCTKKSNNTLQPLLYSCMKRWCFWRASTGLLDKTSHLATFCAWDNSPHLPVTLAHLMRPGIGWNPSCAAGDFT